jgi:hypothetical protein
MAALLRQTILPRLTTGLNIITTRPFHIYLTENGLLMNCFNNSTPPHDHDDSHPTIQDLTMLPVSIFATGDLALQAIILGRETMSRQYCLLCQLSQDKFYKYKDKDSLPWTTPKLVQIGMQVCSPEHGGQPLSGVK